MEIKCSIIPRKGNSGCFRQTTSIDYHSLYLQAHFLNGIIQQTKRFIPAPRLWPIYHLLTIKKVFLLIFSPFHHYHRIFFLGMQCCRNFSQVCLRMLIYVWKPLITKTERECKLLLTLFVLLNLMALKILFK